MKSDRLFPVLVLLLLLLLVASGVLAYAFFGMLTKSGGSGEGASSGPEAAGEANPASRMYRFLKGDRAAPGEDGGSEKWANRKPSQVPPGFGPNFAKSDSAAEEGLYPFSLGMPLMFYGDCHEYGGELSLVSEGAGINLALSSGLMCLDVQRPAVYVPEGDNHPTYHVSSETYDACQLSDSLNVCVNLGEVSADAHTSTWNPMYGPQPSASREPANLLETWHEPFMDGAEASQDSQREHADGGIPASQPASESSTPVRNHYFLGNDPHEWFSDLPAASRASLSEIQPGVDAACYVDQNRLEYLFVFWPGTDPRDIELTYNDALDVRPEGGNVLVDFDCATLIQHRAYAYQWMNGMPIDTPAAYNIVGNTVRFDLHKLPSPPTRPSLDLEENRSQEYRKRPFVDYLSYLGGKGDDRGYVTTMDNRGFAYVAGSSDSSSFGAEREGDHSQPDNVNVFVTKIRISDRQPVYTTILGGKHDDRAFGIAADANGNVFICGETLSPDFATITPPAGGVLGRAWDAFVVKLDPAGDISDFAFRIGGRGDDRAYGIEIDAATNIYLSGVTLSDDFPVTDGSATTGGSDAFITKLTPNGKSIAYSRRVGGSGRDTALSMAVDLDGSAIIVGETESKDFPTVAPRQAAFGGGSVDGFIAKVTPDGNALAFSSYLGGSGDDRVLSVAVDLARTIYVAGETSSGDFPVANALQSQFAGGNWDAFFCHLPAAGDQMLASSYLGGSGDDRCFAVAVETDGRMHVAGSTTSTNFPMSWALQSEYGGGERDAFVAGFDEGGQAARYLTYIGGTNDDAIYDLAMEAGHILHFSGVTTSKDLPVVEPMQTEQRGNNDVLLGRLLGEPPPSPPLRFVPAGGMPNGPSYDYYVSTFEIDNQQLARFLNDAQANPDDPRGTNMHFDASGSVWMNPEMVPERDELFSIHDSRLVYVPEFPLGARYSVTPKLSPQGGTYAHHPAAGASWYGAVKYCNWLTVDSGRGADQRCYREGSQPVDWAPVTTSSKAWDRGNFDSRARQAWLELRGFRLPMENCGTPKPPPPNYFRVTNEEFVDFLNDAQANPASPRGANLFFDDMGNVTFAPAADVTSNQVFTISNTRIAYTPQAAVGTRYSVMPTPPGVADSYAMQPVAHTTWVAHMKYCNWLTLMEDLEPDQRCYREGPTLMDWAPATVSKAHWEAGEFTERERSAWLQLEGFRLPFISEAAQTNEFVDTALAGDDAPTNSWPNAFNEVAKSAGWVSSTNAAYGFGRDGFDARDANFLDNGLNSMHDTTPVGFYDGSDHAGRFVTRTNNNLYGAYDMSGNVSEWTSDPGIAGSSADRAYYGGSWRFPLPKVSDRAYVHPYFTENFMGFRVATRVASDEIYVVRVPLRICICPVGVGPGCGKTVGEGGKPEEEPEPEVPKGDKPPTDDPNPPERPDGILLKPPQPTTTTTRPPPVRVNPQSGGGPRPPPPFTTTSTTTTTTTLPGGTTTTSTTTSIGTTTTTSTSTTTEPCVSCGDDGDGGQGQVIICHHPSGNPANFKTVSIPLSALPAHLAHGDTIGACP